MLNISKIYSNNAISSVQHTVTFFYKILPPFVLTIQVANIRFVKIKKRSKPMLDLFISNGKLLSVGFVSGECTNIPVNKFLIT